MKSTVKSSRRFVFGLCNVVIALAATAFAQVTTTQLTGEVTFVEGNQVVVRTTDGEIRTYNVPEGRTALVDGKEITVRDLKVGTTLTSTVTTTTTTSTQRTIESVSGTVFYAAPPTVILRMTDGTTRQFNVPRDKQITFNIDGNPKATVFELRKGMKVTAQKVTEEPVITIAQNSRVTGTGPRAAAPKAVTSSTTKAAPAAAPAPAPAKAPARAETAPVQTAQATPPPARPQTPAAAPAPQAAPAPAQSESLPARLPKTASPLPLAGMLGLILTAAALTLRKLRQQQN